MTIDSLRSYCLNKQWVTEDFPFDNKTLVFKVAGKMFCLCDIDNFESVNLKCDPENAIQLREQYEAVLPGYHMNKKHWNTVMIDGSVTDKELLEWVDDSYNLVYASLPKKVKDALNFS